MQACYTLMAVEVCASKPACMQYRLHAGCKKLQLPDRRRDVEMCMQLIAAVCFCANLTYVRGAGTVGREAYCVLWVGVVSVYLFARKCACEPVR
jgi:hypothetical protein